jgi:hypothetical protein
MKNTTGSKAIDFGLNSIALQVFEEGLLTYVALWAERMCCMRRLFFAVVIVGVVLSAGVSFAQEKPAKIPEKVRAFLNNLEGTWTYSAHDGAVTGSATYIWDAGNGCLIVAGQEQHEDSSGNWNEFIYWDGVSDSGVVLSSASAWSGGYQCGIVHGKVLSPTSMRGKKTDIVNAKEIKTDSQVEFKGKDKFISKFSNSVVDGKKKPDGTFVFTRVKPTTREDFEEFCRLCQGRWVCDITWAADWPGIGKKGDTVTAYLQHTLSEDGNALVSKFIGGQGSETGIWTYDVSDRLIKSMVISSGGSVKYLKIRKSGEAWSFPEIGIEPDGTKVHSNAVLSFHDNGKTAIGIGSGMRGEEKFEFKNTWHKVSK